MNKEEQKNLSTPTIIGIVAIILIVIFYINYPSKREDTSTASSTIITWENIDKQEPLNTQTAEIEEMKREIEELKRQQSAPKTIPFSNTNNELSTIIKKWRPFVAYIECDFRYADGTPIYTSSGSGLLIPEKDRGTILTNRHVISMAGKYAPYVCRIQMPDDYQIVTIYSSERELGGSVFQEVGNNLDAGFISVMRPTQHMINLNTKSPYPLNCYPPTVGDKVVILGYPAIGSRQDITATEGIISGFDGDYFITSAKVEEGNSGGIAISVKEDCYLGIPTFTAVGSVESLARILDFTVIVDLMMSQ